MALLSFGAPVADARGKLGGLVFSRSRAGPTMRSWSKPLNPLSSLRSQWSSILSRCWARWSTILDNDERDSWNVLASTSNFSNSLGGVFHLSGWGLFVRTNSLRLFSTADFIDTAPASAFATRFPLVFSNTAGFTIKCTADAAYSGYEKLIIWGSIARKPTVNSFRSPYIVSEFGDIVAWQGAGANLLYFDYAEGDRVFLRDRIVNPDGAVSSAFYSIYDVVAP